MIGSFLTGIFATSSISMLDGATDAPGAIDGNGVQVARQLADIASISGYSFTVSLILVFILKYIGMFVPGMDMRMNEYAELKGIDMNELYKD